MKAADVFNCQNKVEKKKIPGSEIHKASSPSSLRGAFERYAVTRARITLRLLYFLLGSTPTQKSDPAPPIALHLFLGSTPVFSLILRLRVSTAREREESGSHAAF